MKRWRLKTVLHLPGPFVLTRESGRGRVIRGSVSRNAGSGCEAVSGFVVLFLLGWLTSWHWRTRKTRKPRKVPAWAITTGLIVLVLAVLILI